VNATKERQAWCCLQVKLCDPCLSALCVPWCKKALYKYSSFHFLLRSEYLLSIYIAPRPAYKALRHWSHSFYLKITPCLCFLRKRSSDGATPNWGSREPIAALLLVYRPRRNEGLSWSGWLTYSGRFTHMSGHPSATGRAQDKESSPAKDRRSTAVPRNHGITQCVLHCIFSQIIGVVDF